MMLIYKLRKYTVTTQYLQEVWNRRRVVYYTILLFIISGELLGEINYIIVRFPEYDRDTLYTSGFHYQNLLQRPSTSPRHNLDPRLGTSIRQIPSCHMLEQHIPQEERLMSQHQVSQIQTINVEALEIRDSEISLKCEIISIQSRLRLI